ARLQAAGIRHERGALARQPRNLRVRLDLIVRYAVEDVPAAAIARRLQTPQHRQGILHDGPAPIVGYEDDDGLADVHRGGGVPIEARPLLEPGPEQGAVENLVAGLRRPPRLDLIEPWACSLPLGEAVAEQQNGRLAFDRVVELHHAVRVGPDGVVVFLYEPRGVQIGDEVELRADRPVRGVSYAAPRRILDDAALGQEQEPAIPLVGIGRDHGPRQQLGRDQRHDENADADGYLQDFVQCRLASEVRDAT